MHMAPKEPDKVQREIEELLDKLDNFVPEDRFASKMKQRRRENTGPGMFERASIGLMRPFSRLTVGHLMLAGIILLLAAWFAPGLFGSYAGWARGLGLILTIVAFVLSLMGWDSRRTISRSGGGSQKRWRGQVIDYSEPTPADRLRGWWRRRHK
jgi:hypothetical protein